MKFKYLCIAVLLIASAYGLNEKFISSQAESDKCVKYVFTRSEAEDIAMKELKNYCRRKNLPLSAFSAPIVSNDGERIPWIFDFTSKEPVGHFVRILIDECGNVEESSDVTSSIVKQ